jgi:glutamine synthetase
MRRRESDRLGLTKTAYSYIGGLMAHARAMSAVICPTVNSYKRIGVGAPQPS